MSNLSAINIRELMLKNMQKVEFLMLEGVSENNINDDVYKELIKAIDDKDSSRVDDLIYLIFCFKLFDAKFIELLNNLLVCDWHKQHENIAILLQKLKSPSSVKVLFETATKEFKYLEYDEFYALAVKCIWALGDIGTEQAKENLKLLLNNGNDIIKENAQKQIDRIKNRASKMQ
ncbi:hypothetical protein CG709_16315 [Lachnotalea glycerini]|nr:hypothetical protein CG709_16315 [Lachnotalea glycerini]